VSINHHPSETTLLAYATGQLAEGLSLVVAMHLVWCDRCRNAVTAAETIGGVLLSQTEPEEISADLLIRTMKKLDCRPLAGISNQAQRALPRALAGLKVAEPLRSYVESSGAPRWRRLGPGISYMQVLSCGGGGTVRLIRVAPGIGLPRHSHTGTELAVVLSGSYDDEIGRFAEGDLADHDEHVTHSPYADARYGCICLIATEGPLRFENFIMRMVQPFTGF
jgi:putative transcriptional regulator